LKQVALLSAVGLIGSFLTVLLWFPLFDRAPSRALNPKVATMAAGLWRFWSEAGSQSARNAVLALLAVLTVWGLAQIDSDDDVRHQQGLSPVLVAEQLAIQRLTGLGQNTRFFLVQGETEQQVLEREEALGERLSGLTGWQSVARFVPSFRRQSDNAQLAQAALIGPHLAAYRAKLGMAEGESAPPPDAPLEIASIRRIGALAILDSLILDEAMHAVTLDGGVDADALRKVADGLDGVRLVDPVGDISLLLRAYRHRALVLLGGSTVLMVPVLVWRYGRRGAIRVLAPAVAAIIATPPLLALVGLGFSFFGAMALVLVLSIGTDYGVFCAEDKERDPVTLVSVGLAMTTTLLSFGLLALSDVAAVRAFGATMLVGVALAFILAPSAGRKP
jgi:predicted exporter